MTTSQIQLAIEIASDTTVSIPAVPATTSIFNFGTKQIRVQIDSETGEIWFLAKDICESLGFSNSRDAIANHVDIEDVAKRYTLINQYLCDVANGDTTSSKARKSQLMQYVNESGMYALIFGSKKPEAKVFKRWVTSEVLPSIRKTGRYAITGETPKAVQLDFAKITEAINGATEIAKFAGLSGNQLTMSVNNVVKKALGIDVLHLLGSTHLTNEKQMLDFTVTEIGKRLFPIQSGRAVNKLLLSIGYQTRGEVTKLIETPRQAVLKNGCIVNVSMNSTESIWCLTPIGHEHSIIKDTFKKHSDGMPITQIRWYESIVPILQAELDKTK